MAGEVLGEGMSGEAWLGRSGRGAVAREAWHGRRGMGGVAEQTCVDAGQEAEGLIHLSVHFLLFPLC